MNNKVILKEVVNTIQEHKNFDQMSYTFAKCICGDSFSVRANDNVSPSDWFTQHQATKILELLKENKYGS